MFDYKDRYENTDVANATKPQRIVLTLFLLAFGGFAISFAISAINGQNHLRAIRNVGVRTTAAIEDRYQRRSSKGGDSYNYVVVGYTANRVSAEHTFEVSLDAYDKVYNRPTVDVYYLRDDPSQVVLADGGDVSSSPVQIIAPGVIGVVVLAILAGAWIYWIRNGVP